MLIQLLRPASRGRPILAIGLTWVGAVTVFLWGEWLDRMQKEMECSARLFLWCLYYNPTTLHQEVDLGRFHTATIWSALNRPWLRPWTVRFIWSAVNAHRTLVRPKQAKTEGHGSLEEVFSPGQSMNSVLFFLVPFFFMVSGCFGNTPQASKMKANQTKPNEGATTLSIKHPTEQSPPDYPVSMCPYSPSSRCLHKKA